MGRSVLSALALKARKEQKRHIEKRRMTGDEMGLREKWEILLASDQTPVKGFIESYSVPTKRPSFFGGDTLVPFREYPLQTKMRESMEGAWARGRGAKVFCGKGRQEGMSKASALLMWERFMRAGGGTWNLFSYDEDAVKELFRFFQSLKRQTPEFVFTDLLRGGGEWVKTSAKAMELEFRGGDNALLQCLTAGDKHSGSGSSPRGLLWDEFSKWKPEVKADPSAMSEGWYDAAGNVWLIPATGQGQEQFAEKFMAVWNGTDQDSGFEAIFAAWIGHPDRTKPFRNEKEREDFIESVGQMKRYGVAEESMLRAAGATYEELNWRRMKLAEMSYNLKLYSREYPMTPADSLRGLSRTVFTGLEDVLESHEVPARTRERAARRGALEWNGKTVVFEPDPAGFWTVLEEPSDETWYCWGADSTTGKQTINDGNGEPDYAVGTVDELVTGHTKAYYRGHTEPREFAREMFKAACWYAGRERTGAYGYVESNSIGSATIMAFKDEVMGEIVGTDLLLDEDTDPVSNTVGPGKRIGWYKTQESTERMIMTIRDYLTDVGVKKEGVETPFTHQFVQEALRFERNPNTGKPEARTGKDDAVISKGLALLARTRITTLGLIDMTTKTKPKKADERYATLLQQAMVEAGVAKVEPAKYWHPRGGRAPRGEEPVEFSDMKGF